MECDVCLIEWDTIIHIPRLLSCGHTFCEVCLISMLKMAKKRNTDFFCPNCMGKHKEIKEDKDIQNLVKNINLLRIVEKIETRKSVLTQSFNRNDTSLMSSRNVSFNMKNTNELVCQKHGLIVHSYAIGTNLYLCNICLRETSLKVYPLPSFVKEFRRKLNSSQMKVCIVKQEIEKLQEFFISYQEEFERSNNTKVDELFGYLNKLIIFNYNTAKTVVNQCKKEQDIQIEAKVKELNDLFSEIKKIEEKLEQINNADEKEFVNYNDDMNDIFQKICYFLNYDLELNLFQMQIGIKDDIKNKLFEIIQNSYYIDVEFANVRGEPATIKHILQKDKSWICTCGETENPIAELKCIHCSAFRKLESYDNLIINPFDITKTEIQFLQQRRKQEIKEFQDLYKNNEKTEFYYVIDIEWFLLWKCFVTNDVTEKYINNSKKCISSNKTIGVLPPGPVNNFNLIEYSKESLRKGLKKNDDYIVINEQLWYFFYFNYNGGPEIKLTNNNDIYTNFVSIKKSNYLYDCIGKERPKIENNLITDNNKTEKLEIKNSDDYIFEIKEENKGSMKNIPIVDNSIKLDLHKSHKKAKPEVIEFIEENSYKTEGDEVFDEMIESVSRDNLRSIRENNPFKKKVKILNSESECHESNELKSDDKIPNQISNYNFLTNIHLKTMTNKIPSPRRDYLDNIENKLKLWLEEEEKE